MKYIKLFEGFESDLQEFCDTHLAYLLDEGFKVKTTIYNKHSNITIMLKDLKYGGNPFKWNDVKDYIIPFIQVFSKKYDTSNTVTFSNLDPKNRTSIYSIESVISDSIPNRNIIYIQINFRND